MYGKGWVNSFVESKYILFLIKDKQLLKILWHMLVDFLRKNMIKN